MAMAKIFPVIMAGGSGTRLWPLSRKQKPKQFQPIVTDETMFMQTMYRLESGRQLTNMEIADPIVVCAETHKDMVLQQSHEAEQKLLHLVLEPVGRNTAPVAAITSLIVNDIDPEGIILLLPADHHITDTEGFWSAVSSGLTAAELGHITTFGIQPSHAETGYGYIKIASPVSDKVFAIDSFREKPDQVTAESYLEAGTYFWNAGIFLFQAAGMLIEFEKSALDILESCTICLNKSGRQENSIPLDHDSFSSCRSDSIDYAIMEKTAKGAIVAPVDIGWNDIGAWSAVQKLLIDNNQTVSRGEVITIDTEGCYIRSEGPVVAAIGLENVVIVATEDAVLVTTPDKAQDVKNIVTTLSDSGRKDLT